MTVNLQPTTRQGPYWRGELAVDNSVSHVLLGLTNVAVLRGAGAGGTDLVASNTGSLYLPQTPETFTHDPDGNLTRDGRWTNSWDAENRLIRTESLANTPASARVRQDWSHLPDDRWSQRILYAWVNDDWLPQSTNRFLWDDKVLLAVLNGSNQPEQTYLRGLDLRGSMQGAGDVGDPLAIGDLTIGNLQSQTHLVAFDGNGNVAALVSADTGTESARYEYDSFGNTLRATGPAARANSLRFSTQFADDVTVRVKYLYRDYDAGVGRWLGRDPIEELGGNGLYLFVYNQPLSMIDKLGLRCTAAINTKTGKAIMVISPGAKWQLIGITHAGAGNSFVGRLSDLTMTYQVSIDVLCKCGPCDFRFKTGTRRFTKKVSMTSESDPIVVIFPSFLPATIPTPSSLLGAIGDVVAEAISSNLPIFMYRFNSDGQARVEQFIRGYQPKGITAGEWYKGHPCN